MLLKGEKPGGPTNKGPYRLNLYLRNPHFLAAPFALRGPKTPVWNPNLQKLMLVMRCVEVRRLPLDIRTTIATCYPFVPSRGPFQIVPGLTHACGALREGGLHAEGA